MLNSFHLAFSVRTFRNRPKFHIQRSQTIYEASAFISSNENEYEAVESSPSIQEPDQKNISIHAKCEPTETLLSIIKNNKAIEEKVKRIQKEFEIYEYFSSRVPTVFLDKHWLSLLKTDSIYDHVHHFCFMGLTEHRETLDMEKKKEHAERYLAFQAEQKAKIEAGGMGYGSAGYNIMYNPITIDQGGGTMHKSFLMWNAFIPSDMPKLLFDCQFMPNMIPNEYNQVTRTGSEAFFENIRSRAALPCSYINAVSKDEQTRNFFRRSFYKNDHVKKYGLDTRIYSNDPFHDPYEKDPKKQVIYLSKYADKMLDGPLIHKAYVIPLTFDRAKDSIGAVRRNHYQTMCLPLRRYIKWHTGPIYVPFINFIRIMQGVAHNGGDWGPVLERYIPKYRMKSTEERIEAITENRFHKIKDQREEKKRITKLIYDSLGDSKISDMSVQTAIVDYARSLGRY